jgi:dihydrofolate reductase
VVDELVLLQYPILLGKGKRLYDDGVQPAAFRLASSRQTAAGVSVNRYVREGEVKTGSFALDG